MGLVEKLKEDEAARLKRVEAAIQSDNAKADAVADGWLDKLKASKWTAFMILGLALVATFLIIKAL